MFAKPNQIQTKKLQSKQKKTTKAPAGVLVIKSRAVLSVGLSRCLSSSGGGVRSLISPGFTGIALLCNNSEPVGLKIFLLSPRRRLLCSLLEVILVGILGSRHWCKANSSAVWWFQQCLGRMWVL